MLNDTFLLACKGQKTDYTPIWLMRQAGRYMAEYREIRQRYDFLTLCKTPELAVEVTLQPVNILGVDAAILFSDILIPLEPVGFDLEFSDKIGPVIHNPVRCREDLKQLKRLNPNQDIDFISKTIKLLKNELKVPLIGFSGAPFTLATYIIEGGVSKNFVNTKSILYGERDLFDDIMEYLTQLVLDYLHFQIEAGVDAIQIFDTWLGVLIPADILEIISRYINYIIDNIKNKYTLPIIYFPFNCSAIFEQIDLCNCDVLGVDWRIDIARLVGFSSSKAIQGNLDPCALFGNKRYIKDKALDIISSAKDSKGHIFNLGHGILPDTPVDNVKYLVEVVHNSKNLIKGGV
ncbi:MAG: uroporphyrinogen decarboxylase [Thermodesulfovibrionales bacterium]|nr:uroporphyrinogen decarboxylase [Thermodesulfovibrionales bacterium]